MGLREKFDFLPGVDARGKPFAQQVRHYLVGDRPVKATRVDEGPPDVVVLSSRGELVHDRTFDVRLAAGGSDVREITEAEFQRLIARR